MEDLETKARSERSDFIRSLIAFARHHAIPELQEKLALCGALAPLLLANVEWRTRNSLLLYNVVGCADLFNDSSLRVDRHVCKHLKHFLTLLGLSGRLLHQVSTQELLLSKTTGQWLIVDGEYKAWLAETAKAATTTRRMRRRGGGAEEEPPEEAPEEAPEPMRTVVTEVIAQHSDLPTARFYLVIAAAFVKGLAEKPTWDPEDALTFKLLGVLMGLWPHAVRPDRRGEAVEVRDHTARELRMVLSGSPHFAYRGVSPWEWKRIFLEEKGKLHTATQTPASALRGSTSLSQELLNELGAEALRYNHSSNTNTQAALEAWDGQALAGALRREKAALKSVLSKSFSYSLRNFLALLLYALPMGAFDVTGIVAKAITRLAYTNLKPDDKPAPFAHLVLALFAANLNAAYINTVHAATMPTSLHASLALTEGAEEIHSYVTTRVGRNAKCEQHISRARELLGGEGETTSQISTIVALVESALRAFPEREPEERQLPPGRELAEMEVQLAEVDEATQEAMRLVRSLPEIKRIPPTQPRPPRPPLPPPVTQEFLHGGRGGCLMGYSRLNLCVATPR